MKKNYKSYRVLSFIIVSLALSNWGILLNAQIHVNSFTPTSGHLGTTITISGSNFNATPGDNVVYFGATAGSVLSATSNSLTVNVPSGANYENATVTDITTNLTAYTDMPFIVTFPCGGEINSGSFGNNTDITLGNLPNTVSAGDLDGDGKADLLIANNGDNTVSILKNTSIDGIISFAPKIDITTGLAPKSIAVGDLTGDGKLDFAVIENGSNTLTVFKNTRFANEILFGASVIFATGLSPQSVSIADIDKDGMPDLIVTNAGSNTISILRNTSSAFGPVSFSPRMDFAAGNSPQGITISDVDGDQYPDIICTNYSSGDISVFRNTSISGSISLDPKMDITAGAGSQSVSTGDLDGDGKRDIAVANNLSNTISLFRNTSSVGVISLAAKIDISINSSPMNLVIADIDGDGMPDFAVTNNGSNDVSVIKNRSTIGNIIVDPKVDFATGVLPVGLSIIDLDGNGKPEMAITNNGKLSLFPNMVFVGPLMTSPPSITICTGTSVNLTPAFNEASTYIWIATDNPLTTGESLTGQTGITLNDTIVNTTNSVQTVTYSITPTSNTEGCVGAPQSIQVFVNPLPDANAGADTLLTCNNPAVTLTGTSTSSPVTYQWNTPGNNTINAQTITAGTSGVYILMVTNSVTLCANTDSMLVSYDTVSPLITSPLNYQITDCIPGTVTINGTSDNISDSIKWMGPGIPTTNPAIISTQNNYSLIVKRNSNGCITTQTISVTNQVILPSILIPIGMDTIPTIPILDTLTCGHDSVLLNFTGSSAASKIKIIRPSPMNDTVSNTTYTTQTGIYKAIILDTITGCTGNSLLFDIKLNVTLPQLIIPVAPPFNCSYTSAALNGVSGTPNSILSWSGPNNFSSVNPATITLPGDYVLSVTDPANGCIKTDTLTMVFQNILVLSGPADTTLCKGDTVQLTISAIGGTPNFTYDWNNNAGNFATANVSPEDTTQYIVIVTDSSGCVGRDTVFVNIPTPIADSTLTFKLCNPAFPTGLIQINAFNGVPPYKYSIDNGQNYQSLPIFSNLPFGTYPFLISDALQCVHADFATIDTLSRKPNPDFIVNTSMMQADTFVVVDISNPRPDTVIWTFPPTVSIINNDPFAPVIVSADTGSVNITMETHFETCIMYLTKTVQFIKADTMAASPNGKGIEKLTIFPNPNSGQFSVEVKLYKKQSFVIYVYNSQGIEQTRIIISESNYSLNAISIPNPIPGTYVLKVIAEYDSKSKTIVITQ